MKQNRRLKMKRVIPMSIGDGSGVPGKNKETGARIRIVRVGADGMTEVGPAPLGEAPVGGKATTTVSTVSGRAEAPTGKSN